MALRLLRLVLLLVLLLILCVAVMGYSIERRPRYYYNDDLDYNVFTRLLRGGMRPGLRNVSMSFENTH